MLFDQDKNKGSQQPKKRSIWGTLFNPDIGDDIRPMVQETRMFVRMLAMILASNRLFPKDHPAFTNDKIRLTLSDVLSISWNRLSWTKEGLPQILLFAAVFGCLIFSALFVITFLLSLFVSPAHAQSVAAATDSGSMFVPNNGAENDLALNWLDYIFLGKDYTVSLGEGNGVPSGAVWQKALGAALSFYSGGVLVLAGFILLYHLISMIAETAHTGKPMGKANQIWAPIRLVVAIGLLIPIGAGISGAGDTGVSGLNTGQYLVIQVAKWGSGLASNVWNLFSGSLNSGSPSACTSGSPSCIKAPPEAIDSAKKMIRNYLCAVVYNSYLDADSDYSINTPTSGSVGTHLLGAKDQTTVKFWASIPEGRICGGYKIPEVPTSSPYASIYQVQNKVFAEQLSNNFLATAKKIAEHYSESSKATSIDVRETVNKAAEDYWKSLNSEIQSALPSADKAAMDANSVTTNPIFKTGGWLPAGAVFTTIASQQAERSLSVTSGLPEVLEGILSSKKAFSLDPESEDKWKDLTNGGIADANVRTVQILKSFSQDTGIGGEKEDTEDSFLGTLVDGVDGWSFAKLLASSVNPVRVIASFINKLLKAYNVINDDGLAIQFNSETNPLQEVVQYGQNLIGTSMVLFGIALALFLAGMAPTFAGVGIIGAFLATLALPFFTGGALLGFMLPLVPFFRFFFGALTWIVGVFEAVVAAPLFALAHLNPNGDGLPGGTGRAGYFLILSIFLRPVLMVFGLVAGLLIFFVALSFLNVAFILACKGTTAVGGDTFPVFAALSYTVFAFIYCGTVYTLGNNCFKTIGVFPQQALRWLGQGAHHEGMGDPNMTRTAMMAAGTYVLGQGVGSMGEKAAQFNQARRDRKNKLQGETDAKTSAAVADQRHGEKMAAEGMRPKKDEAGNIVKNNDTKLVEYERDPEAWGNMGGNNANIPASSATGTITDQSETTYEGHNFEDYNDPSGGDYYQENKVWNGTQHVSEEEAGGREQFNALKAKAEAHKKLKQTRGSPQGTGETGSNNPKGK